MNRSMFSVATRLAMPLGIAFIIGMGALVLLGWQLDIPLLKSGFAGIGATMKANTAFCFLLSGISLGLLQRQRRSRLQTRIAEMSALFVGTIGLLTLLQYGLDWNLGIDEWLFQEPPSAMTPYPGRMGMNTAVNFILIGAALWLLINKTQGRIGLSQMLAWTAVLITLLAFVGYLLEVDLLYRLGNDTTAMALNTIITFTVLCGGLLLTYPNQGLMRTVTSPLIGGVLLRRLLPWMIVLPLTLSWILQRGERLGWYSHVSGDAYRTVVTIILLSTPIWWTAQSLNHIESNRQQAEADLRHLNETLESRVAERTAELAEVNRQLLQELLERQRAEAALRESTIKLEQSNQELQNFAFMASHDLKEPLRTISNFSSLLQNRYQSSLDERGRDYLDRLQKAAKRMQVLIDNLLALARVTADAQPFVPVNLTQLVQAVVSSLEAKIQETGATIVLGDLPTISAEPSQMQQLLQNLISNAIKFHGQTPPVVKISSQVLSTSASQPANCQILVEDNGIGFDEKQLDRIFKIFERLHGRDQYEGTGMGLAMCRKIVERHNGTITARSSPGRGSTFIVTLPLEQSG